MRISINIVGHTACPRLSRVPGEKYIRGCMVYVCKVAALFLSAPGTAVRLNSSTRCTWRQKLDSVRKCTDRLEYPQTVVTFWGTFVCAKIFPPSRRETGTQPPCTHEMRLRVVLAEHLDRGKTTGTARTRYPLVHLRGKAAMTTANHENNDLPSILRPSSFISSHLLCRYIFIIHISSSAATVHVQNAAQQVN